GLLELSSLKLGKVGAEPELCDAAELARSAVAERTPASGVELRLELPDARVPIHTDPTLVLRILNSLVSNALKFTEKGSVTLRVRTEAPESGDVARGDVVVWEVEDTGIGIDEANLDVIFDEFRQADGSA